MWLCLPRPSYLSSWLSSARRPDADMWRELPRLADLHVVGDIRHCWRAPRSANSANVVVETNRGRYLFRRHRLSVETIAHECEVLDHLRQCNFPSPRLVLNRDGQAWSIVDGTIYGVYEF